MDKESQEITTYWNRHWKSGNVPPWHLSGVNYFLEKYLADLTDERTNLRFLVPLCGSSVDLLWLAEKGHWVVGVEICRDAIEKFFDENMLEYMCSTSGMSAESSSINVFKARKKDITIFQFNFFAFTNEIAEGQFDAVWDRQSLVAYKERRERKRYIDTILSVLAPNGRYLIETFDYDPLKRGDNPIGPHRMTLEEFSELFTQEFNIIQLENLEFVGGEGPDPLPYDYELHLHLLTLKKPVKLGQ